MMIILLHSFLTNLLVKTMSMLSIEALQSETQRAAVVMGGDEYYPYVTFSNGVFKENGAPYITVDEDTYRYTVFERGSIIESKSTCDNREILYWIASHISFSIAMKYATTNKREHVEFRRVLFQKQLEILYHFNFTFGEKERERIKKVLEKHPFTDGLPDTV